MSACLCFLGSISERIGISRPAGESDPATDGVAANLREEARKDRIRVCDKIIAVFRAKPSSDWRKLIAFSKQWSSLHERCTVCTIHRLHSDVTSKL